MKPLLLCSIALSASRFVGTFFRLLSLGNMDSLVSVSGGSSVVVFAGQPPSKREPFNEHFWSTVLTVVVVVVDNRAQ